MKKILITSCSFLIFFGAIPTVFAGDLGIAQLSGCTGLDCSACNIVYMANGGINWLIGFLLVVFALLLAIAGVKLVTSGGNHHALDEAKNSFMNAIIGFIIILAAWLIVDTIMRALVGRPGQEGMIGGEVTGWLFWTEVECQTQTETNFIDTPQEEVRRYDLDPEAFEGGGILIVRYDGGSGGSGGGSGGGGGDSGSSVGGSGLILSLRGGGTVNVAACGNDRTTINFLGGSVNVQRNVAPSLQRIDARWRAMGGQSAYRVTSVGGYSCRPVTGNPNRMSVHAYGLAVDINPAQNPYGQTLITNMPSWFVSLFRNEGWGWGGNWNSVKDAMHFSKAGGEQGDMRGE